MDLLVVGGSGFLGLETARRARFAGHSVAATFHSRVPAIADVDWRRLDIRHRDELAASPYAGIHHPAGPDAISRYELGVLIARRDGLDQTTLPTGLRAGAGLPGPIDVRLDSTNTQARLNTRLRGAREFLAPMPT